MQVNLTKVMWYYGLRHPRQNQAVFAAAAAAILTAAHHLHVTFFLYAPRLIGRAVPSLIHSVDICARVQLVYQQHQRIQT